MTDESMATKKSKGRTDGEGSIYQLPDGRYAAQVTWFGPDGKRHKKRRVRKKESDAAKALTKLQVARNAGRMVVTGRTTLGDWLDLWLEQYVKPRRAPSTYDSYYRLLKSCVPDFTRKLPLSKVPEAAETFDFLFNHVRMEHGGRTSQYLRTVLRASLNVAVKKKKIEANPILHTETVEHAPVETATFNLEEALRFLDAAKSDRLGAMFTIMLSLGLREGEGSGLKADDIDIENNVLHVRRSLQWCKTPGEKKGGWIERPPKAKSKRDLPITATIRQAVVEHMARRQQEATTTKGWTDSGYLFTSVTGAPLHARNVLEAFHTLCDKAGVPRIRVHDTRHSCATLLHAQGADGFTIQQVLGHSQLSTTKRYTHVPVEVTRPAITAVESALESERKRQAEEREKQERAAAAKANIEVVPAQTALVQ